MADDYHPISNNNRGDAQLTDEAESSVGHQEISIVLGQIQRTEPEDPHLDTVGDKMTKQPKSSQSKQSLWLMKLKAFCNEASVVGLRYVANPSASVFRRSIWVLLLLVGAGFTTFQIQNRILYFAARPVNVNLQIKHSEEVRFPTVTVCNENRVMLYAAKYIGECTFCYLCFSYAQSCPWVHFV